MGREAARAALAANSTTAAFAVSWLPAPALDAVFWGRAATPAEALAAFVTQVGLDAAFVPAASSWAEDAVRLLHDRDAAAWWAVDGPLGRVAAAHGWSEALRMTAAEPALLAAELDRALHDTLTDVRAGIAADADAIVLADDIFGASGPLISPDYALEVVIPLHARAAAVVNQSGRPALFHTDGDARLIHSALARAGFVAIHVGGIGAEALRPQLAGARAAGIRMLGGIAAADLMGGLGATAAGRQAGALAAEGLVVTDDGGVATPEELSALVTAFAAARRGVRQA